LQVVGFCKTIFRHDSIEKEIAQYVSGGKKNLKGVGGNPVPGKDLVPFTSWRRKEVFAK